MAGILPPVSGDITLDNAAAMASIADTKAAMAELSASTDALADSSTASADAAAGLGAAGTVAARDTETAMEDAAASTAGLGTAAKTAADDTKTAAEDAAGSIGGIGVAAKDAETDTSNAMKDSSTAVKDLGTAAEDAGGKTTTALEDAGSAATNVGTKAKTAAEDGSGAFSKFGGIVALAGVGAAIAAVKMSTDFQASMTLLVTGAGQAASGLNAVKQGILGMAGAVGQTPEELAKGMYLIESAGYKGAAGLNVLKASAEGASVGNADMATVANAVTTALTDYHLKASDAAAVTSALVETVASGKTNMDALAGSLGKVMPTAAALGVTFADVTGAMATMTNAGLSARFAASHLQNTLLALSAPSSTASAALKSVGLTTQEVKDELDGPSGLNGALALVTKAVGDTFPAGSVASVTAFKNIMGGATGYSTALMLGGKSTAEFATNVNNINGVLNNGVQTVQGFNKVQGDLKFQLDSAKASAATLAIEFGDALLPKLEDLLHWTMDIVGWFEQNKDAAEALAVVVGGVLATAVGVFAVNKISAFISSTKDAITALQNFGSGALTAAQNVLGVGTSAETAATTTGTAMTEMDTSANATLTDIDAKVAAFRAELEAPNVMAPVTGGEVIPTAVPTEEGGAVAAAGAGAAAEDAEAGGAGAGIAASAAAPAIATGLVLLADKMSGLQGFMQSHLKPPATKDFGTAPTTKGGLDWNLAHDFMTDLFGKGQQSSAASVALAPLINQENALLGQIHADAAKDASLKSQSTTFQGMLNQLSDLKVGSAAYQQAIKGVEETATTWYPQFAKDKTAAEVSNTLSKINDQEQTTASKLEVLTKDQTLKAAQAALDGDMKMLSKEETQHASVATQTGTQALINQELSHIAAMHADQTTLTKDATLTGIGSSLEGILRSEVGVIKFPIMKVAATAIKCSF